MVGVLLSVNSYIERADISSCILHYTTYMYMYVMCIIYYTLYYMNHIVYHIHNLGNVKFDEIGKIM